MAPTATFKNYKGPSEIDVNDIPAEFGLCSRALYNIYDVIKDDPNCLLTVSASQVGMMGHVDLIHDTPLKLDWKNDVILGSREFLINSNSDILAISKIIEKQRSTKPTKMN